MTVDEEFLKEVLVHAIPRSWIDHFYATQHIMSTLQWRGGTKYSEAQGLIREAVTRGLLVERDNPSPVLSTFGTMVARNFLTDREKAIEKANRPEEISLEVLQRRHAERHPSPYRSTPIFVDPIRQALLDNIAEIRSLHEQVDALQARLDEAEEPDESETGKRRLFNRH